MENAQSAAIAALVDKAVLSLEALGAALDGAKSSSSGVALDIKTVEEDAKQLHATIEAVSSQRVLALSSDQLMEAGIVLYNASRATFKSFQASAKKQDAEEPDASGVRFSILFVRFMAARVMGLALTCSTSGHEESAVNARNQSVIIDDCLDVLRSYGRVGSLLLETAAVDAEKCFEYLTLSKDALDNASAIWGRVGLACLTRFKEAVELEIILQDLWDFSVDRVRAIRLLQAFGPETSAATTIIETLHELQMLLPYMLGNGKALLELIQALLDEWGRREQHADRVVLAEEALRLCDSMDSAQDGMEDGSTIPPFKRGFLCCLLNSASAVGDVEKAEACYALLGSVKESSALITMLKLYLQQQHNDKATTVLKLLFQRDDVASAILGARLFVETNDMSDDSINLYRQLERHYGDHVLEIGLDLACCLAASESQHRRAQAIQELRRLGGIIVNSPSDVSSPVFEILVRIRQTIHDAAQVALSAASCEECAMWAELGIEFAENHKESASFKRLIAASSLKVGRAAESWKWAQEALSADSSKASLFSVFEASLALDDPDSLAVQEIIRQLREREDFKPQDLIPYGYAAHSADREDTCLFVMDQLCCLLDTRVEGLPLGILLQNTAQLALARTTANKPTIDESTAQPSFATSLLKYADLFLKSAEDVVSTKIEGFAPQTAFTWFYATSFNVARSCNDAALFVRAADFAVLASRFFGEDCPISGREQECLTAALSTEMASFESCDRVHLEDLLVIIGRINAHTNQTSDQADFVAKCELAVRLRLYDPDVDAMRKLCHEKVHRNADNCIELGELILHATHYDEAKGVRKSYCALASELFKLSLQLLLQSATIPEDKLSYIFRRLITLAESRNTAFEWLEQLVQLSGSVECKFPDLEAEWFISKAWNMGVQQHRCQSFDEAQKFMQIALTLQASIGSSLKELAADLHQQYQSISALDDSNTSNAS